MEDGSFEEYVDYIFLVEEGVMGVGGVEGLVGLFVMVE